MQKCFNGIFLIPFFIISLSTFAQQNSVSPYSRLGVGDLQRKNYTRGLGMGGATIGMKDAQSIDMSNPASYANLALTSFDIGVQFRIIEQQQENPDVSVKNSQAGIRYFSIGVPIKDWWGSAFGVQPYSYKGYNITNTRIAADGIEIVDNFVGSGSMSQVYWGNAFTLFKNFSVGVNTSFLFGKLVEENSTSFEGSIFNSWQSENLGARGFNFDLGAQYSLDLANNKELGFGATYTLKSKLNATMDQQWYVQSDGGTPIDSLNSDGVEGGNITLPTEFKFGLSYGKKTNKSLNHAWLVAADFELYQGSEFKNFSGSTGGLADGYRAEVGGFVVPSLMSESLGKRNNYLSRIEYRLGAFYGQTPYTVGGHQLEEYGISFGMGLPVRHKNLAPGEVKASTVNIGAILGRRGTVENGLIQENYLNIYLGINLNDKWFIKYKYR
ncbi:hypothetical protein [Owenweeksia hongkongensis]|uniref:hypothetical protein n=1 Tax=Owenweeksia hongkongensis TaxID=253245 RepID=UPI003A93946B